MNKNIEDRLKAYLEENEEYIDRDDCQTLADTLTELGLLRARVERWKDIAKKKLVTIKELEDEIEKEDSDHDQEEEALLRQIEIFSSALKDSEGKLAEARSLLGGLFRPQTQPTYQRQIEDFLERIGGLPE